MINYEYLAFVQVSSAGLITDEWAFADLSSKDGGEYALVEYAPVVAPLRISRLGGSGSYDEVAETLTVHCLGSTPSAAVAAYERLIGALDIAARWLDEEADNVIQVRVRTIESTVGELAAVVLGAMPGEPPASVSATWDQGLGMWAVRNVALRFRRRGLWLNPTQDTATSSTVAYGELMTATLANQATASPCIARVRGVTGGASGVNGYVMLGAAADQFSILNAKDGGLAGGVGVADGGTNSRSGTIVRFTAASGATSMFVSFSISSFPARFKRLHVFCNLNNSNTSVWSIFASHFFPPPYSETDVTLTKALPTLNNRTRYFYLGALSTIEAWNSILVRLTCIDAPSYPRTIEMDTIVLVGEDDSTGLIAFADIDVAVSDLTLNPRALSAPSPLVSQNNSGTGAFQGPLTATGDAYIQQRGANLCGIAYIEPSSGLGLWRISGTVALNAARNRGYRVPQ